MEVLNHIVAIISILSICATFFLLGQAYEIMKQCQKETKDWSKK